MRSIYLLAILFLPLTLCAQEQLQYRLHVNANLEQRTFSVQGTLSFRTTPYTADSVEIVLSKCSSGPDIQLLTPSVHVSGIDTAVNDAGDMAYHIKFSERQAPGALLEFRYQYERGSAPSFQYCIDSNFVMACGYGSAWYPQVTSRAEDGTSKYTRGAGTITVTTSRELTAVMAASTLKTTISGQNRVSEFSYTQPDIFTLYIGHYRKQAYQGSIPFYSYSLGAGPDTAAIAEKAAGVLDYLKTQFGPLDLPNFSVVEFPDYISEQTGIGGASILGGILMPSAALKHFNYALFGHELSHQWWGNKIISSGAKGSEILSEGMAQYGSLQVVMHFDSSRAMLYRKTGYPGYIADQSGLGYLKNIAAGNDEPLIRLTGSNGHILGDSKGFLALELLSEVTGKERFNKALQAVGDKYQHTGLSWDHFVQELEKAHGSSLQWFFREWFERTGAPAWETSWQQQGNRLLLTLTQKDSVYHLPLEVLITYASGAQVLKQIRISERVNHIALPVTGKITAIKTDPYFKVLHWDEELAPVAREMGKVQRVQNLRIAQKTEEAEKLARSYLQEGFPADRYGVEFSLLYQLGRMKGMQQKEAEALQYYQRALQCPARAPDLLAYTYYRIAQIAVTLKDKTLLQWASANAVKADAMNNERDDMAAMVSRLDAL